MNEMKGPRLQSGHAVLQPSRRNGRGVKVGIVASQYNSGVVEGLLESALEVLVEEKGVKLRDIQVCRVPGAFEIPLMASAMIDRFDVLLALACVIRGETAHFDHVLAACRQGLMSLMLEKKKPIAYGVLAVENQSQAEARSRPGSMNRGAEAARAAVDMRELLRMSYTSVGL